MIEKPKYDGMEEERRMMMDSLFRLRSGEFPCVALPLRPLPRAVLPGNRLVYTVCIMGCHVPCFSYTVDACLMQNVK